MPRSQWIKNKWPNEAQDFTPWLQDNLHLISDCIGLELYSVGREVSAAGGRADIVAWERKSHKRVVIENQLDVADARHFQQLISYGDSLEARVRIWVAASFSNRFERLITDKNKKEELREQGAIYYLMRLDRCDDDSNQVVLRLDVGPTQRQIENVFLSADERKSKEQLIESFWNWYGRNRRAIVSVGNKEKLHIIKSVNMNEAKVLVLAHCFRGFRRKERIQAINSYARGLLREFPQANAREDWGFDEVSREILETKLSIDLSNPKNWENIRQWFLKMDKEISAPSGYPPHYFN